MSHICDKATLVFLSLAYLVKKFCPLRMIFLLFFNQNTGTHPVLNDAVSHTVVQFNNGNCQGHKQYYPPAHTQPSFINFKLNTRWRHILVYPW